MCSADSPGRLTSAADPVLIFDLDGTLLPVNSFPRWARYMLFGRFGGLTLAERLALRLRAAEILAGRKLLRRSHAVTKSRLQALWADALRKDPEQAALRNLTGALRRLVRPNLEAVLDAVAQGGADAALATSAAAEYAEPFARRLGFPHILCSEAGQPENRAERKRDRALAMLAELGWERRRRVFFTDHEEDLPLMRACDLTLWFGDERGARLHADAAKTVPCRALSGEDILRLSRGHG